MAIKGIVVSAINNKPLSNILVGLYMPISEDSIVFKEKPLYISKTNSDGEFSFSFLPNSPFKIMAIKDDNKNLMYDGSIEEIGFNIYTINPTDTFPIQLKLFKEKPNKQFLKKTLTPEYGKAILVYNIGCDQITKISGKGIISYSTNPPMDRPKQRVQLDIATQVCSLFQQMLLPLIRRSALSQDMNCEIKLIVIFHFPQRQTFLVMVLCTLVLHSATSQFLDY